MPRLSRMVIATVVGLGLMTTASAADGPLPNIVLLYADDMGYGDLGVQNPDSKIPTPNLDRLAKGGLRLTDAHSSSGICTPSRYALLTGRYHWRKFHDIVNSWEPSVLDADELTLPEMLKQRGYTTACIGKWHLGWDWSAIRDPGAKPVRVGRAVTYRAEDFDWSKPIPDGPLAHGFDTYFGDDVPNFPPYAWIEDDRVVEAPTVPYAPNPVPDEGAAEGRPGPMVAGWRQEQVMPTLTRRVVEYIEARKDAGKPFFLYFPWTSPHAPILPTDAFKGKTGAGPFGDFVAQSDHHAGMVLNALDRAGLTDTTLVIFTADNGPERYAYERIRSTGHRSAGPLRGLKRDIWEGGHRVPCVIRWPGHVKPGTVSDGLFSQVDLFATIAAAVGFTIPDGQAEDSHDQLALWTGGPSARDTVVHNTYADKFAIRHGDWVLIDAKTGNTSAVPAWFDAENGYSPVETPGGLYKLSDDLSQHVNRYAERPDVVADLRTRLEAIRRAGEVR